MHGWNFVIILPTASVKMVKKKQDISNIFFNKISPLEIELLWSLRPRHRNTNQWEETCRLLSMMVLDALESIATRSVRPKIIGTENLEVGTWGIWTKWQPNFVDPWIEGSKLYILVDRKVVLL
jgi:hypothetical protein